jgi:hypothetical protein
MIRSWKLIENIYDIDSLRVDPLFLKLPLAGKASNVSEACLRYIARRTLEVAIARATDTIEAMSEARNDVQTVHRLADNAQWHVGLLVKNLAPPTQPAKPDENVALAATLLSVLAGSEAPVTARRSDADILAQALIAGREACGEIAAHAKRKDKQLASANRNQGAKDKAEFVLTFAEVWTALTSSLPPTSRNRNTFFDLLAAGWRDAGQTKNENFSRAIRDARAAVEPQFVELTGPGPDWLWLRPPSRIIRGL